MIYAAGLAPYIKRAKIKGLFQSSISDIRAKLPDDPKISKMDVLALTDKDVTSLQGKRLLSEIPKRNEAIQVVYIYQVPDNANLIPDGLGVHKFRLSKLSGETVGRVLNSVIGDLDISKMDKEQYTNDDPEDTPTEDTPKKGGFFGLFKPKKQEVKPKKSKEKKLFEGLAGKKEFDSSLFKHQGREESADESISEEDTIEVDSDLHDLQKHALSHDEIEARNNDFRVSDDNAVIIDNDDSSQEEEPKPEVTPTSIPAPQFESSLPNTEMPQPRTADVKQERKPESLTLEKRLARLPLSDSYDLIKDAMTKEAINKELLTEDTEYAGCKYTLEQWDREMLNISRNTTMSAEERLNKIRELAYKRVERKGTVNNKLMQKMSVIMNTVTEMCQRTIQEKTDEYKKGLATIIDVQLVNANEEEVNKLIEERNKISVELREYLLSIVSIYQVMDVSVRELINTQAEDLPSANSFINDQFALEKELFIPQNAAALSARILSDLKGSLLKFSQMEGVITDLIESVFKLIDKDSAVIQEQEKRYQMLKAVRVEDTVTITNVLKNALRIFVGPESSGVTATALTWAGLRARRQNTILIDLRNNNSKLENYGETPMDMQEFLESKEQKHFVVLKGVINSELDIDELLSKLTQKTDYYSSINLIFDNEQVNYVNRCIDDTLSVNIITDSAIQNVLKTKQFMEEFKPTNVGIKVVAIDPAVERLEFLQKLNIDQYVSQLVGIAYLKDMRQCAIRNEHPYERKVIADVFEEAFR